MIVQKISKIKQNANVHDANFEWTCIYVLCVRNSSGEQQQYGNTDN